MTPQIRRKYVTLYVLKKLGACESNQTLFRRIFDIQSVDQRVEISYANLIKALEGGLDVWWLMLNVISREHRDKYMEDSKRLLEKYSPISDPDRCEKYRSAKRRLMVRITQRYWSR